MRRADGELGARGYRATALGGEAERLQGRRVFCNRAHFDAADPRRGYPRGNVNRFLHVARLDQVVASELLLGFHERPVRRRHLAVAETDSDGGIRGLQPITADVMATRPDGIGELGVLGKAFARFGFRHLLRGFRADQAKEFHGVLRVESIGWSIGGGANRHPSENIFAEAAEVDTHVCRSARQVRDPLFEEPPLGLLPGERDRALVRRAGIVGHAEPPAQVGPGRVREVVIVKIAAREDRIDQRQTGSGAVAHRDRDGAVQLDHRRRVRAQQHVVEADDLVPVRLRRE